MAWSTNPAAGDRPPGMAAPRAVLPCVWARYFRKRYDLYFTDTEIVEVETTTARPMPDLADQIDALTRAWPQSAPDDPRVSRVPYSTIRRVELMGGRAALSAPGIQWWGRWGRDVPRWYGQEGREKNLEEAEYAKTIIPNILPLDIQIELVNY